MNCEFSTITIKLVSLARSCSKVHIFALLAFAGALCFGALSGQAKSVNPGNSQLNTLLKKLDAVSCAASGFIDNLDGTVCDCTRNLMWEKKTGTVRDFADFVICTSTTDCPDPRDVNNTYSWSSSGQDPDGTVYTVFLAQLNDAAGSGAGCFAGHCDWRLPEAGDNAAVKELETILDFTKGICGGGIGACINPIFGPTSEDNYWSSTTLGSNAVLVTFGSGFVFDTTKDGFFLARAVRPCE